MPWIIAMILVALWLVALVAQIGGGIIHMLLVIAGIVMVVHLSPGRQAPS